MLNGSERKTVVVALVAVLSGRRRKDLYRLCCSGSVVDLLGGAAKGILLFSL